MKDLPVFIEQLETKIPGDKHFRGWLNLSIDYCLSSEHFKNFKTHSDDPEVIEKELENYIERNMKETFQHYLYGDIRNQLTEIYYAASATPYQRLTDRIGALLDELEY